MVQSQWKSMLHGRSEKGYSWLFWYPGPAWSIRLITTLIVIGTAGSFYIWYYQFGNDVAPDSIVGFAYAIAGTLCFVLAATLYTARRRSRQRAIGQLNTALSWHIFLAVMGIALLLMHSFGNFNAKTGTYALYSLIALMVSGFVGRILDRVMPRLIAGEVDKILTAQGEDRVETISRDLQTFGMYMYPATLLSEAQQQVAEVQYMQLATRREQFYRYVIRYWRLLHITVALLTIVLIIWHLVYVAQLLVPVFFHRT